MKFSIIIPTYEAHGRSTELLTDLLNSLKNQTYNNLEIIVSDHSQNFDVENLCNTYLDINIIHFYNKIGLGNSSINMNEGIKKATGDVIKIMHMDDIMCNKNCLNDIYKSFCENPKSKWGALSFNHNYEIEKKPNIKRIIVPNINTVIGCPSVSFFKLNKENTDFFDENLIIINDHDMHQRLYKKYGSPIIIGDEKNIYITIRMHDKQVSSWVGSEREKKEWEYFKLKKF
jgi:glycosyltransferase involved in cell wall biosynthesis